MFAFQNFKVKGPTGFDETAILVWHMGNSFGDLIFHQIIKENKFHKTSSCLEFI